MNRSGRRQGPGRHLLGNDRCYDLIETVIQLAEQKSRTPAQLKNNLPALDVTLTQEDHQTLDAITPPGTHPVPYYQASWEAYENR